MSQDSNTSGLNTPTKGGQGSDGPFGTPQKRKLEFDFWKDEVEASPKKSANLEIRRENIAELTPGKYMNSFILFRVSNVLEMKHTKVGQAFSFQGLDESGEITMVAFRELAVSIQEQIVLNTVYKLTNFKVKEENPYYKSDSGHANEILLDTESVITPAETADTEEFPTIPFKFMDLSKLKEMQLNAIVDVLGVVVKDWGLQHVANDKKKRDIAIVDQSGKTAVITMWGSTAENFAVELHEVVAIRKGHVSEYNEIKFLNCWSGTLLWANPDLNVTQSISQWFQKELAAKKQ